MPAGGPFELRPAFVGEIISIVDTVEGSGSITGQTYEMKVWGPDGVLLSTGVSCSITDAANRKVTGVVAVTVRGVHHWSIRRTDSFLVSARGTLIVLDDSKE